jgi:serine protease Do
MVPFRIARWIVVLFLGAGAQAAQAQSAVELTKNAPLVVQSVAELAANQGSTVVEIRSGNRQVALGTVVSSDGLVVTKASVIDEAESLTCHVADDRQWDATIVAQDELQDLALLRIEAGDLIAADLSSTGPAAAGSFLISVGKGGKALAVGIAVVDPRRFTVRQASSSDRGYLGIDCSRDPERRGLVVTQVSEASAARRSGIRQGDVIQSIDDQQTTIVSHMYRAIGSHKPGETIHLQLLRGDKEIRLRVTLGTRPLFEPYDQWGGGPFSERRFGFDSVVVHDAPIPPELCGGPVIDTDGRVVGINIARALRVATFAIPSGAVAAFVRQNADVAAPAEAASN